MAVRLLVEIEKQFGAALTLASIFRAPTVAQMADMLRESGAYAARSPIVAMQPRGTLPPLWCAPAAGGSAFFYQTLSRYMGDDQPFYVLEPRGLDGHEEPLNRIADLAAFYLKAIREVQPAGPYYLAGLSHGGLVAYEMARQLRADGEEAAIVILIDTAEPSTRTTAASEQEASVRVSLAHARERARYHLDNLRLSRPEERMAYVQSRLNKVARRFGAGGQDNSPVAHTGGVPDDIPETIRAVLAAGNEAVANYTPGPYDGYVALLRAHFQRRHVLHNPTLGWDALVGSRLEVIPVAGSHRTIIEEPYVRESSAHVKAVLEKAR
jgi:thioesterase domain-containing protein